MFNITMNRNRTPNRLKDRYGCSMRTIICGIRGEISTLPNKMQIGEISCPPKSNLPPLGTQGFISVNHVIQEVTIFAKGKIISTINSSAGYLVVNVVNQIPIFTLFRFVSPRKQRNEEEANLPSYVAFAVSALFLPFHLSGQKAIYRTISLGRYIDVFKPISRVYWAEFPTQKC
ncbi:hypothetical protein I7I53_03632 [Histoplasma capsulatum var. duboisii H88]|uniref:Uncharacterized protein n=1 Tax=Ajellomyces capsulatus (strain H88) TaxID=544711 RepID=A0A8A1LPG5_AJEC8|nr:hypothetical protein I7I53_03632 [Histoplasma capsulatum var. duboisii H88]